MKQFRLSAICLGKIRFRLHFFLRKLWFLMLASFGHMKESSSMLLAAWDPYVCLRLLKMPFPVHLSQYFCFWSTWNCPLVSKYKKEIVTLLLMIALCLVTTECRGLLYLFTTWDSKVVAVLKPICTNYVF